MHRKLVNSSNIASIGYDEDSLTLEVEFNNGAVYQYFQVPPSLYSGIMSADSHGKFLEAYIKGTYSYREV